MTHSAAMAGEILIGKTILEALNTDLVCDAINTAMRSCSCRSSTAAARLPSPRAACPIGTSLEDLGKGLCGQVGTIFSTKAKGPRYLSLTEGYITRLGPGRGEPDHRL